MSSEPQDEQTGLPPASQSDEGSSQQSQPQVDNSAQVDESSSIPAKFVGKSAMEIAQSYRELEKERGRIASELGQTRKEREEMEARYRDLERQSARFQQMPTQAPPPQQAPQQVEDPFSSFDTRFEDNPKEAIKEALKRQTELLQQQSTYQGIQARAAEANDWYYTQKKNNPDYARREKLMQSAAQQFADIIRPEHLNSIKALQVLDLVSKGMDVDYYSKQAVEHAKKDGLSTRDEKRRAMSESSSSDGEKKVDFKTLSIKEMEQLLGRSDD